MCLYTMGFIFKTFLKLLMEVKLYICTCPPNKTGTSSLANGKQNPKLTLYLGSLISLTLSMRKSSVSTSERAKDVPSQSVRIELYLQGINFLNT